MQIIAGRYGDKFGLEKFRKRNACIILWPSKESSDARLNDMRKQIRIICRS